jgi:hypothetical protein
MISNILKILCFAAFLAQTSARSKGKFLSKTIILPGRVNFCGKNDQSVGNLNYAKNGRA